VRPKDKVKEIWTGIRAGVEGAVKDYGADEAYTLDELEAELGKHLGDASKVFYRFGVNEELDAKFNTLWGKRQLPLESTESIVNEMRLLKSKEELALMRYAGIVSAQAHMAAMQIVRAGMTESQLQAVMEAIFRFNGATYPAYTSIVGGGANATILHYVENNAVLQDGDLVLIDAACEYLGYASDITRCFPVNGKFSPAQKALYEIVLEAEKVGIAMAKPGVCLAEIHDAASNSMRHGLVALGLLPRTHSTAEGEKKVLDAWKKAGSEGEAPLKLTDFYMHSTSHWIGRDVHDVGTYGTRDPKAKDRKLEPGMCFTVEPGLYISKDETRVPLAYRGIGIRIEDDVAITEKGHEVLSQNAVKEVKDIEGLMKSKKAQALRAGLDSLLGL
jgi:Xaa-Pro aminopeptidase